jgi:putative iron-only hydrogenase system regulator
MTPSPSVERLGFIGIVIEDRATAAPRVNAILSDFSHLIIGRMGIPYRDRDCSVITLIVDCSTSQLGSLTGKLGQIPDVQVKSALTK